MGLLDRVLAATATPGNSAVKGWHRSNAGDHVFFMVEDTVYVAFSTEKYSKKSNLYHSLEDILYDERMVEYEEPPLWFIDHVLHQTGNAYKIMNSSERHVYYIVRGDVWLVTPEDAPERSHLYATQQELIDDPSIDEYSVLPKWFIEKVYPDGHS